ncbi:MAG TPA: sigma-70 family RNA polymerase sigma factor [Polyangiaceae bacterium]|nr:sigma-70 family RNA polymerase sigma factor [Polyangiaceae bacterium]
MDRPVVPPPFLDAVKRIALAFSRRLPRHVDRDDVYGAAYLGLAQALVQRRKASGQCTEAYVRRRVRGAVIDHLRALDLLSRRERASAVRVVDARARLRQESGVEPSDEDVATAAQLDRRKYSEAIRAAGIVEVPFDLASNAEDSGAPPPDELLELRMERERLANGLKRLAPRSRRVLSLYYERELTFRQIGRRLGVSESRACQLRKAALAELGMLLGAVPAESR